MIMLIGLLIIYSVVVTYTCFKLMKENKIYYSNYKNALKALAEYDKELARYLESKERR